MARPGRTRLGEVREVLETSLAAHSPMAALARRRVPRYARHKPMDDDVMAAADALDDARAQRHHPSLSVRVFYPSLHLNLAEDYRALDRPTDARHHLRLGEAALDALDAQGEPDGVRASLSALRQRLDAEPEGACEARRS